MVGRLRTAIYPFITLAIIILVWSTAISAFKVPDFILPTPMSVLDAIIKGFVGGDFFEHFKSTLWATLLGYVFGCGLAFLVGVAVAESDTFDKFIYPCIVALQSMPKVALAPLILVWFGFEIESKIILVALICFFPLFVNTVAGIRQTDPELIDICRAFSASRRYLFFNVKLPSAASEIFAGLQIGVVLALIGAVVAEFIASKKGLGHMIDSAAVSLTTHNMFAGVIILGVMGVAGTAIVRVLQKRVVFWETSTTRVNLDQAS
jgi:NitT/TauT family transport system permease protein